MAVILNLFRKGGNKGGNDKGKPEKETFKEFTERKGSAFFAAGILKDSYTIFSRYRGKENDEKVGWKAKAVKKVEDSQIADFEKEMENVKKAEIQGEKKTMLLELYSNAKKEDAWDREYTTSIAASYINGVFGDEQLDYSTRALNAWRSGKIKEFAEQEKKTLETNTKLSKKEKEVLGEMADIALAKDDISTAIIMRRFVNDLFDDTPAEEKLQRAEEAIETFKHL